MYMTTKQISASVIQVLHKNKLIADRNVRDAINLVEKQLKNHVFSKQLVEGNNQ